MKNINIWLVNNYVVHHIIINNGARVYPTPDQQRYNAALGYPIYFLETANDQ